MAKTLQALLKQIAQLQKQADGLRNKEKTGVVARIKEAIAYYSITPQDLFDDAPASRRKKKEPAAAPAAKSKVKPARPPKYTDGAGRTWSGMGKRPAWFTEALAAGKQPEELLIR